MSFRRNARRLVMLIGAFAGLLALVGADNHQTLRDAAARHDIAVGTAVIVEPLFNDPQYAEIVRREFNMMTTEIALKWDVVQPQRGVYQFDQADLIMYFARTHGMQVRGHTLVWHRQLPGWLEWGGFSRDELLDMLREHIQNVVGRYQGQVAAWDVVNEVFNDDGTLRDSLWLRVIGPEYIALAFEWAHEADPDALLFINDYNNDLPNAKSDAIHALVQDLRARGVPIHGVGFQMHLNIDNPPPMDQVAQNFARFAELGVQLHITEMDVSLRGGDPADDDRLARQAGLFADAARVCIDNDACTAFVTWGFTDRHTWLPGETGYPDAPLLYNADYQPKPAYRAVLDAFLGATMED